MAKVINFNVAGTPTDTPIIYNDDLVPKTFGGVFEGNPPNRCVFTLPDTLNGGGHLQWDNNHVYFLLPAANTVSEADALGLPPLIYEDVLQRLHVSGDRFVEPDGSAWSWRGLTHFRLLQLVISGQDIRPLLDQAFDAGFNVLRVLAMKANNTGWELKPGVGNYWDSTHRMFELLEENGFHCEFTVFADTRAMMPNWVEQQGFWNSAVVVAQQHDNVFLELVNEYGHSTQSIAPSTFTRPTGVLASHGSGLSDATPVKPLWDYATYHARREADGRGFTNYDPYEFERDYPKPCPYICDEGIKPEGYGYHTDYAFRIGQHADCGAGGTFHYGGGVNGQPLSDQEFSCATAFTAGIE